jgi:putative endonuclease
MIQHKRRLIPGFTKKYNVHRLVYFEQVPNLDEAINQEKQLKWYTRAKKRSIDNVSKSIVVGIGCCGFVNQ